MRRRHDLRDRRDDRGSAVVEFVLAGGLLVALVLGVLQLGLALHVRNALVAAAGEGARFAALADRTLADGLERTDALVAASLGPAYAVESSATITDWDGIDVVRIDVAAPMPVLGLLGPSGLLEVTGRAPIERPR